MQVRVLPLVVGGALQRHRFAPLAMGAGMTGSFATVGILLGAAGPALGLDPDTFRIFGAAMLIAFAIVMAEPKASGVFTRWMVPIATGANAASSHLDGGSLWGAAGLGALLGLVWSPCSGPLLGTALTLVASEGGLARGGALLGLFGLGAAMPLVAAAYASRKSFERVQGWVLARSGRLQGAFALVLGLTGIAILTGGDKWLEAQLVRLMPQAWVDFSVGI